MGVDTTAATGSSAVDCEAYRLRAFVEALGPEELEVVSEPVELADVAARLEGNPKAVLFEKVGPEGASLVGNVVGSRTRLARAFGVSADQLLPELLSRLRRKPQTVAVTRETAPVQEVVLTGADADLTALPVHLQHGLDGGPYLSASIDYVKDPRTGWTNVGVRRLMLRGRREAGVDLVAPSDLRAIYLAQAKRGEALPIAFVVGQASPRFACAR